MYPITVRVISPTKLLFNEPALSVSSKNKNGKFDILAEHANFITIVENESIIIKKANYQEVEFKFPLAIIYTSHNKVNIYTYAQN